MERLARVAQRGGAVGEPAGRLQLGGDVGQLELHRLELRDRLAELLALLGVVEGEVEHGLGEAERQRGDGDAADLERPQELAEAEVRVADEVLVGDPHVVEVQLAGVEALPPDAPHLRAHREPGRVLLDDEAWRSFVPGAGEQGDAEGHVGAGVGDERLAAVDQPAAVAPLGPGADAPGVGAGVGLGEAEGAERPALGQRPQPALALLVVAEQEQRQRADRDVRLPRGGHRLVGEADLLHGGDEADRGHADAAPLLGDEHAEQAELAHLAEQVGRAARLLPRRGARGAISFWAKSRHRSTRSCSASVSEKSIEPILLDRPVQAPDRVRRIPPPRSTGRRASAPQAAAGGRVPPVRALRLRRGHGRPHHRPRPRAARPLLGQPARTNFKQIRVKDLLLVNEDGEVVEGRRPAQQGGVRHPLADPRRPARRRGGRPLPLGVRQGVVDAAPPARSAHPGRLRVLRRPRRVRRLQRGRARGRGGQAHRPRPRRPQGGHPRQPRPAHRRPDRRRGGVVVHHHGAHVPGPAPRRGRRHPADPRSSPTSPSHRRPDRRPPDRLAASSSPSTTGSSRTSPTCSRSSSAARSGSSAARWARTSVDQSMQVGAAPCSRSRR